MRFIRNAIAITLALPGAFMLWAAMNVCDPRDGEEVSRRVLLRTLDEMKRRFTGSVEDGHAVR
jgi:hypothetical protein